MKLSSHTSQTAAHSTRGVTLIEMLVALVITALIVSSVYVAFNAGTKAWQVGDTMMQKYQNARGALDMMSREIVCALINDWDNQYRLDFYGSDGPAPEDWRDDSVGDELYFVAKLEPGSADADLCEVGYYLTDEDGDGIGDILRRFYVTDSSTYFDYEFYSPNLNAAGDQLSLNVTGLDFRYYDGSSWQDTWDSRIDGFNGKTVKDGDERGTLPKAVQISITVQDDKHIAKERIFRTVVYLPGNNQ